MCINFLKQNIWQIHLIIYPLLRLYSSTNDSKPDISLYIFVQLTETRTDGLNEWISELNRSCIHDHCYCKRQRKKFLQVLIKVTSEHDRQ